MLVGLLCLTVAFGRIQNARADIEAASRAAARAASIERTAPAAWIAGERGGSRRAGLRSGYPCDSLQVDVDTSGFAADASVATTVSCTVRLSDVTGMGIPSSHTLVARFSEPIDRYRGTR